MNHSEYIFGNLTQGYSQYPDDYTRSIFTDQNYSLEANSQIVIHREATLVYYNYYRKLSSRSSQYIGLSVCFNGLYFKDVNKLFNIFEQAITEMAISGGIIEFADNGDVIAKAGMLYLAEAEIKRITKSLRISIDNIENKAFEELPALNYGISKNDIAKYSLKDINAHQGKAISSVSRIVIYKDEDFNTAQLSGYAQKLTSLNSRNEELSKQNVELLEQVNKLSKQKKQYRLVVGLVLVLLGSLTGLYFFNKNVRKLQADIASKREVILTLEDNVNKQKEEIGSLNSTISRQNGTILDLENQVSRMSNAYDSLSRENSIMQTRIESLNEDNSSLKNELTAVKKKTESLIPEVSSYKRTLSNLPSFIVTEVLMDCGSRDYNGYLYAYQSSYIGAKVRYYGIKSGNKTLCWKLIDPDGTIIRTSNAPSGYTIARDFYIFAGEGELYLTGVGEKKAGGYWKKGTYRIEIYEKSGREVASQYFELK